MTSMRIAVPPGCIAAVVTHLEMLGPPPGEAPRLPRGCELRHVPQPTTQWYRALYRAVGEDWLWFSRLELPESELAAILSEPAVEVYVAQESGRDIGMVELDWRVPGECELVFFGVIAERIGRGAAAWMIAAATQLAWRPGVRRFWLHTCSLDHPAAVPFYEKHGFRAYKREVEIDPDPRLSGTVSRNAAVYHPILE